MTADAGLPRLPFERRDVLDVPSMYRTLRAERPISRVRTQAGDVAWLVTGYENTRRLLNDERLGRSHPEPERAARISGSALIGGPQGDYETEKAGHDRMRRLLVPAFSARRMNALRGHVQTIVDERLDQLAAQTPPADLHETLSFPLPALVICELLGVPYADREYFRKLSDRVAGLDTDAGAAAREELAAYMHQIMAEKRRAPVEDVLSDLATAEEDDFDEHDAADLAGTLLFAGHETTVSFIDFGTVLLVTHPDQRDALRRDPGLAPAAVEEILRVSSPSNHGLPRYAHADIDIEDVTIRTGEAVLIATSAANRDEQVFADPDRFDILRQRDDIHVTFGYGPRFCIGASLARVELQTVFRILFQRFPTLRLAVPFDELRQPAGRLTPGFTELPVTWDKETA